MKTLWSVCSSIALFAAALLASAATISWIAAPSQVGVGTSAYIAVFWLQVIALLVFAHMAASLARN